MTESPINSPVEEIKKEVIPPTENKQVEQYNNNLIDQAKEQAKKLEKLNEEVGKKIKRLEELEVQNLMMGKGQAGAMKIKEEEMSDIEYANAVMDGKIQMK